MARDRDYLGMRWLRAVVIYTGESDCWHDDYDRGRPGWPPEAVSVPCLPPEATVLELGAGTGKLTGLLVAEFDRVMAMEPDEGMRRLLVARCPQAQVIAGRAEDVQIPDASIDGAFIAEAFHLFATEQTVGEIARVLRPGGALVLLWNLPAGPTEPSIAAVEQLMAERGPDRSKTAYDPADLNPRRYASGEWRLPFATSQFGEFREARLPNLQIVDRDGLLAFFASMGWIADLPDQARMPLADEIQSLLPAIEYQRPWETRVHWARLTHDSE